jgi:hypothetical protein
MDQRVLVGLGMAAAVVAVLLLGLLIAQDTGSQVAEAPAPAPVAPAPAPPPPVGTAPAPRFARVAVTAPPDVAPTEPLPERPVAADVGPEQYREMNYAMDDVINDAREECIRPWLDRTPEARKAEFVFDAVLYDGRMYDFGLRSLSTEVPGEVMSCIRDQAWYGEWPDFELKGQLTLQRSVEIPNRAALDAGG